MVSDTIKQTIIQINKEESAKHTPGKFYPSSVGKCLRQIVYQMLGYEAPPIDAKGLLIMNNGTYFHDRIEHILKQSDIFIASELPIKSQELNISGRLDILARNVYPHKSSDNIIEIRDDNGVIYTGPKEDVLIIELKSINSKGFAYVEKNGPKLEHKQQVHLYMYLTGIVNSVVLYENKDTQDLCEYHVPYNKQMAEEVVDKITKANYYYKRKILPEREYTINSFDCKFCPYKEQCWEIAF